MAAPTGGYTLPPLPYDYAALEPHIDEGTMRLHHTAHHQGYTDKMNQAYEGLRASQPDLAALPIEKLLQNLDKVTDPKIRGGLRNAGGGYVNHALFWKWMAPSAGGPASGEIAALIERDFGSFDKLKEEFSNAATTVFGSGWAWIVLDTRGGAQKLKVVATANQDNPAFEEGVHLILGLDVWEHAYYKLYGPKRAAYITAWWNVVNWSFVNEQLGKALRG
jgi:Fe-Mn family superoxide dismutase